MTVNGRREYRCLVCGTGPDAHSIRTRSIRVYNVSTGKWSVFKAHGFRIGE